MTGPPRDWDKELAQIDKLMASTPAVPAQAGVAAPAARGAAGGPLSRRERIGGWVRVLLGVAAAVAASQWPYPHACGLRLWLFLGVAGTVVVAGAWGLLSSWRRRLGLAHLIALIVTLWGLGLVATVVLPRIGYARDAATWSCP